MADGASSTPEVFVVSVISRLLTDLVARNDQVCAQQGPVGAAQAMTFFVKPVLSVMHKQDGGEAA
jgi:hypothetical protein